MLKDKYNKVINCVQTVETAFTESAVFVPGKNVRIHTRN